MTTLKNLKFEDCYNARVKVEIQGLEINFIDLENLKKNKRAIHRVQLFSPKPLLQTVPAFTPSYAEIFDWLWDDFSSLHEPDPVASLLP